MKGIQGVQQEVDVVKAFTRLVKEKPGKAGSKKPNPGTNEYSFFDVF